MAIPIIIVPKQVIMELIKMRVTIGTRQLKLNSWFNIFLPFSLSMDAGLIKALLARRQQDVKHLESSAFDIGAEYSKRHQFLGII